MRLNFHWLRKGNGVMDDHYTFDAERLRTQEDLMGWIVAELRDSAELQIVEL